MDDEERESGQWPSRGPRSMLGVIVLMLFLLFCIVGWATGIVGNDRVLAIGYLIAAIILSTMIALVAKKIYSRQREPNADKAKMRFVLRANIRSNLNLEPKNKLCVWDISAIFFSNGESVLSPIFHKSLN